MSTVAEQLRTAREKQGLTVYQIADLTKIKTDHVRALDEGDFDAFSAPVFLKGFVRTYAGALKLDVSAIMTSLDAELNGTEKFSEPPPLTNERKGVIDWITFLLSRVNWGIALPLLVLIALVVGGVLGFRAWKTHQTADPFRDLGPGLVDESVPPGDTLPLPE